MSAGAPLRRRRRAQLPRYSWELALPGVGTCSLLAVHAGRGRSGTGAGVRLASSATWWTAQGSILPTGSASGLASVFTPKLGGGGFMTRYMAVE